MYEFKKQLTVGQRGAQLFHERFKTEFKLTRTDGKEGDFIMGKHRLELKTDDRAIGSTENIFIEQYRNTNSYAPGGPWQAKEHGCKYFAYYFWNDNKYFLFNTDKLLKGLPKLIKGKNPIEICNSSYPRLGFIIPFNEIISLTLKCNTTIDELNEFKKRYESNAMKRGYRYFLEFKNKNIA